MNAAAQAEAAPVEFLRGTGGWWFLLVAGCWLACRPDNDNAALPAPVAWPRSWGSA